MARSAKQKMDMSQLYLYVQENKSRDYYHIDVTVVAYDHKQKALLQQHDYPIPPELRAFKGFRIICQGTNDEREQGVYGQRYSFRDVYEIGLEEAETMADILRRAKKGLDAYEKEYGYSRTYGQFVGIIAKALGFDYFLFDREPTDYNDSHFSMDDRRYAITKIDRMITQWQEAGKMEMTVAENS